MSEMVGHAHWVGGDGDLVGHGALGHGHDALLNIFSYIAIIYE
jgi:hypothetical protein